MQDLQRKADIPADSIQNYKATRGGEDGAGGGEFLRREEGGLVGVSGPHGRRGMCCVRR